MIRRVLFILMLVSFASCATRRKHEQTHRAQDVRIQLIERTDTIQVQDTIRLVVKGDTIYKERIISKWRTRHTTDTLRLLRTDTLRIETTKPPSLAQRIEGAGAGAIVGFVLGIVVCLVISIRS